ncbi:uncharacterized protein LOC125235743 [Leguminivora glycinivorella]|uniref:uncharacterized protein LOC125232350 n=1 Tax=Leguminivora glycinivorella TaxID=1035111 RepID=UPI00200D2B19|nr:uncharacterized protein LOC125232350 [Leguminivora glycinivorella]XP_047998282.1 uncharacterized protein LOC125235743 [Leguminivora glycinivorella]
MKHIVLLLLTIPLMQGSEIKLESLDDGPGVLPYKLGPMRLTTHYHTYLQYIQLDEIKDKISLTFGQLQICKARLVNDTYLLYENQIIYLVNKLQKVASQLETLEPARVKRGLVNGLGTVIKSISGNLDQSDAINYNNLIKNLQLNQNKIVSELNSHVSLSKDWASRQGSILDTLVENQKKINATLEVILDSNAYRENSLIKYAKFAQLLIILSENVEDLSQELLRIENSLAFIRSSSAHHSMIEISVLRSMLDKLKLLYGSDRVLDLELREYYDIIRPGSYYTDSEIVITFQFPIIASEVFDLFRLSIVPNRNQEVLIPPYPFLATHEDSFMYMEAECPKFNHHYVCEKGASLQLRTSPDCINRLIKNEDTEGSCHPATVSLSRPAMEELDGQHYIISLPRPTKIQLSCNREDFTTLQGSYLVTIPLKCYLRTAEFTITNDKDVIKGHPIKLADIPREANDQANTVRPHISLKSMDLKGLHDAESNLIFETPLQLDASPSNTLYHTTIPLYVTLILGAGALTFAILRKFYRHRSTEISPKPEPSSRTLNDGASVNLETHRTQDKLPSIFSLNVGK